MVQKISILIFIFTLQNCVPSTSEEVPSIEDDVRKLATNQIQFALDFYRSASDQGKPNRIMSAFSVSTLFGTLYQGSAGDTAEQIHKALNYELNKTRVMSAFREILTTQKENHDLDISNSIWNSKSFRVLDSYKESVREYVDARTTQVDFGSANATDSINDWVSSSTDGKIPKIFDEPLNPDTLMVLVNAAYFKGDWKTKFLSNNTRDHSFKNNGNVSDTKSVPMMSVKGKFRLFESKALSANCLELEYALGTNMRMVIVLPNDRTTLETVEGNMTAENLLECFEKLRGPVKTNINVTIPKFKMESDFNLVPILRHLGVRSVFSGAADLSGISEQRGLYVTGSVQRAFVQVNEEGTQVAAVTAASMSRSLLQTKRFFADRPFLFFILNTDYNLILFTGRVAEL